MTVAAMVAITLGVLFLVVSAVGLVAFRDFFARAHVVATSESLGVMLVVIGILLWHGFGDATLRLVLLVAFAAVANPTAVHALARARVLQEDATPETLEIPTGWSASSPSTEPTGRQPGPDGEVDPR